MSLSCIPLTSWMSRKIYDAIVLESPTLPPGVTLDDVYRDHPDALLYKFDDAELSSQAIARLHVRLREHCDIMGVGLAGYGSSSKDTAVEDKAAKIGEGVVKHTFFWW